MIVDSKSALASAPSDPEKYQMSPLNRERWQEVS